MITSANWLHRPLKLDVISRLSLQNITTALREQPSMIIDNARHRMEPEPHHNPQQIYSNFTQEEIQTCQLGVETCAAAALQLPHLHPDQYSKLLEWF